MAEHWRRDEATFYNFLALSEETLDAPAPLGGLRGALMSRDPAHSSATYVVEIPAGWRAAAPAEEGSLEFFLLRGDLGLEGDNVGAGGYLHTPQLCGGGEFHSESGAKALAFWNPNAPAFAKLSPAEE